MAADILLSWPLVPDTRVDGSAMQVDHILLETQPEGASGWTEIAQVPPTLLNRLVQNVAGGTWNFRGTVVPTVGPKSDPVSVQVVVPFAQASPLPEIEATLS